MEMRTTKRSLVKVRARVSRGRRLEDFEKWNFEKSSIIDPFNANEQDSASSQRAFPLATFLLCKNRGKEIFCTNLWVRKKSVRVLFHVIARSVTTKQSLWVLYFLDCFTSFAMTYFCRLGFPPQRIRVNHNPSFRHLLPVLGEGNVCSLAQASRGTSEARVEQLSTETLSFAIYRHIFWDMYL